MRPLALAALLVVMLYAVALGEPPLDTSYLRDHSQTRGFMLGRPVRPKVTPDGKSVLFRSTRASHGRFTRLFTVPETGGPEAEIPLPMAEEASYSTRCP